MTRRKLLAMEWLYLKYDLGGVVNCQFSITDIGHWLALGFLLLLTLPSYLIGFTLAVIGIDLSPEQGERKPRVGRLSGRKFSSNWRQLHIGPHHR